MIYEIINNFFAIEKTADAERPSVGAADAASWLVVAALLFRSWLFCSIL